MKPIILALLFIGSLHAQELAIGTAQCFTPTFSENNVSLVRIQVSILPEQVNQSAPADDCAEKLARMRQAVAVPACAASAIHDMDIQNVKGREFGFACEGSAASIASLLMRLLAENLR